MLIIGCDYHPSVQQIAWVATETGECGERRLMHRAEAEQFYRELKGKQVHVGIEATGHSRWFERLMAELNFELWVGDPAQIRAKQVRKQKTDRRDAEHILKLMLEGNFPSIWVPTPKNRDLRQLVLHRHRLVGMRTRVMNQLQAVAMNEGIRQKKRLWSEKGRQQLESLSLMPWTAQRRQELLQLLDQFDPSIDQLGQAIEQEAERIPEVKRLMTHPGVGPITALAFVLVIGTPERFGCGKQVASYWGLIPCEDSSADRWRLGHITKQGNALLRYLLGQAAQSVARCERPWQQQYAHLTMRRNKAIAKTAMARKLAVRLFWMWRKGWDYQQLNKSVRRVENHSTSCWSDHRFDSLAEAAKFPDHPSSAPSSRLCGYRGASLFVTHTLMKNDPDQATEPMGDSSDGLIVSQARDQSTIDNLENGSFRPGCSVGSLIENAPHLAVPFGGAVAFGYFRAFFVSRACSYP